MTLDEYEKQAQTIRSSLAYRMGVEIGRVSITNPREMTGVTPLTMESWAGVKVDVSFTDPNANSPNRKSSAALAGEFVALRSTCATEIAGLQAIYYKSREPKCDRIAYADAKTAAQACATADIVPACQCWATSLFEPWGTSCQDDELMDTDLQAVCGSISTCRDASIMQVCNAVRRSRFRELIWLWCLLGVFGGGLLFLGFIWQRKMLCFKVKMKLNDKTNHGRMEH